MRRTAPVTLDGTCDWERDVGAEQGRDDPRIRAIRGAPARTAGRCRVSMPRIGRPQVRMPANLALLTHYQRAWLRGDVLAGLTVAAYLVPQVMAYAVVAGLPAITGLWAMLPCMLIYAVVGSSRQLSVGPESTTALLTASIVAPIAGANPSRYAGIAAELALVFGVFCLLAWALRLGFVADLLSRPVLVGYLAGVAVIMAVGQLGKVTGQHISGDNVWSEISSLVRNASNIKPASVCVAIATILLLLVIQRRWTGAPGALIAVASMTVAGHRHASGPTRGGRRRLAQWRPAARGPAAPVGPATTLRARARHSRRRLCGQHRNGAIVRQTRRFRGQRKPGTDGARRVQHRCRVHQRLSGQQQREPNGARRRGR